MNEENKKSDAALREEKVLEFWKENNIFKKSLEKVSPKGEYVFYEGPPTANGKPGIHHLEARAFKDAIPRYKTMTGFHVRRKGGWDTHGLPVELQVEKKLGLTSKKDIEEYGIAKFNKECKESVWEYTDLWEKFTDRIGYWVDQKNPYVTYHNDYIESVWNVIKTVNNRDLLYKDYKVVPWCPRCGTTLSSHELAQGYQDVKDLSVTAKFKVKNGYIINYFKINDKAEGENFLIETNKDIYILAWTTTPWTLPGNVALAVGENMSYCLTKVKKGNEEKYFILSEDIELNTETELVKKWAKENLYEYEYLGHIICNQLASSDVKNDGLVGLEYEPLYPYLSESISDTEKPKLEKAFKIYTAPFVTTEDGTGIVHIAPMYGVDDFNVGTEIGLPKHHTVGLDGKFLSGTGFLDGRFAREEDVAIDIIKDLAHRGLLFKKEKYEHSYPHCWRCKTALIYYARDSWYIKMSSLRDELVKENEGINWEPSYIKEGRFGEWLKEIKDWAISRERYWGTPFPMWICNSCDKKEVIGSIADLKSKVKKSGNRYIVMRHGESENNLSDLVSTSYNNESHLTEKGKEQVEKSAIELKDKKIDLIFTSPFVRTRDTTDIVASVIGIDKESVTVDDRLHEMSLPMYEGGSWSEYHKDFPNTPESFYHTAEGNETYNDMKKRTMSFIYDMESKYQNKTILIVTHGGPAWLAVAGTLGYEAEESLKMIKNFNYLQNAEFRDLDFVSIPHNENYELDLHRPYIDEVDLVCECGGKLERSKEVMDVWLDSGTMPFSQDHYPFENKEFVDGSGYPADFISEAIDQTRGWFYTLHAVGVLMGRGKAYKNVICLGHILDANGKKMSKSLGNIVDPWLMMDKYGVDTLRLWMYGVNQPGESKSFDEKTVAELHNKVFNLLHNVLVFNELYREKDLEKEEYLGSSNILDQWIVARLNELVSDTTNYLDKYKLLEPVRDIRDFIDDLSTWYVRRSRERLKNGDKEAKKTLYFVLKTLSKLMAPFTPFVSEDIWQKLKTENDVESIHLESWPESKTANLDLLKEMKEAREIVTLGLQARQKAGIPVRQPLNKITITDNKLGDEYIEILKDELNIKNIEFIDGSEQKIELDTYITEDLKKEGNYRELVRAIQDMRKKNGLIPSDIVSIEMSVSVEGQELVNKFKAELMKAINAKEIHIKENSGVEIKIDDIVFIITLVK